jgi:hypothetical protein
MTAFDRAWDLLLKDFVIAPTLRSDRHSDAEIRGFTDQQVKPIYQIGASPEMQGSTTPLLDAALEDKKLPNTWNNFGPDKDAGYSYQKGGSRVRPNRVPSSQYTEDYVVANLPAHFPRQMSWNPTTGEIHQPERENEMIQEIIRTLAHEYGHQATGLPMIRDDGNKDVGAHEIAAHTLENPGGLEEHERATKNLLSQEPTARMPRPFIRGYDE